MDRIHDEPIDARELIRRVEADAAGAVLTFAGVVRETNRGRRVIAIDYHAYRPMAEREARRIEDEVRARWQGVAVFIAHRVGRLEIGEMSVLIAVSSAHRAEGFEALRWAIDTLKERLPIWKREVYIDGESWLEGS